MPPSLENDRKDLRAKMDAAVRGLYEQSANIQGLRSGHGIPHWNHGQYYSAVNARREYEEHMLDLSPQFDQLFIRESLNRSTESQQKASQAKTKEERENFEKEAEGWSLEAIDHTNNLIKEREGHAEWFRQFLNHVIEWGNAYFPFGAFMGGDGHFMNNLLAPLRDNDNSNIARWNKALEDTHGLRLEAERHNSDRVAGRLRRELEWTNLQTKLNSQQTQQSLSAVEGQNAKIISAIDSSKKSARDMQTKLKRRMNLKSSPAESPSVDVFANIFRGVPQ